MQCEATLPRIGACEPDEVGYIIGSRGGGNAFEDSSLALGAGDNELPTLAVLNAAIATELIEELAPSETKPGFERSRRVVDAGVNNLAVARTDAGAGLCFSFQDDRFQTASCQAARDGQAHDPGTDHYAVHCIDHATNRLLKYRQRIEEISRPDGRGASVRVHPVLLYRSIIAVMAL
jgi:hypothetical protein